MRLFQRKASELYGIDFSPSEIKVRFEIEQPALESSPYVTADALEMTYVGKQVRARRYPTEIIPHHVEYDPEYESVNEESIPSEDEEYDDDDEFDEGNDYIEEDD